MTRTGKKTQIKVAVVHIVKYEEVESITTTKEEPKNEKDPLLSLQESVSDQNKIQKEIPLTPPSPSRYMRRLPPPPGFYLAKEHSYAQLCPLEWRKRYEKATDNLEKALRLLRAARRRENRLRLTLLRLQESRLKQTLCQIQDRKKESHEIQGRSSQSRQTGKLARSGQDRSLEGMEENEIEGTGEEIELLTVGGSWRKEQAAKLRDGVEDEEGCCFYCGRGREDEETKEVRSSRSAAFQGRRGRPRNTSSVFRETVQNMAESKPPVHHNIKTEQLTLHSQPEMLLQMHALPGPTQSTSTFQKVSSSKPQLQHLHVLQPDLGLLHPDPSTMDTSVTQSEDGGGGMRRVFLVPVSSESKEKSRIGGESAIQRSQSILMAEETFQDVVHKQENDERDDMGLSHSGMTGNQNDQQINVRATLVGGDVTQRLKEHLEGFHLQLSSEFTD